MSYQASGAVVILPGAVILLAGAAVVGTGILIGKGAAKSIMWCHDKMEENYRSACQSFADLRAQAEAEVRARSEDRQMAVAAFVERYASGANLAAPTGKATEQGPAVDPRILAALQQAREALSANQNQQAPLDYQTEVERRELAVAIRACRGIVAPVTLDAAEAALNGSLDALKKANADLEAAARAIADTKARQQRIANELRVTLDDAKNELTTARALVAQRGVLAESEAAARFKLVEQKIDDAAKVGEGNSEAALVVAREALDAARGEVYRAAAAVAGDWDDQRRLYARVEGQLDALANLVSDIETGHLAPAQRVTYLRDRIATIRGDVARAQNAQSDPAEALPPIEAALAYLKDEAFAQADGGEQRVIGEHIADTLRELGFESAEEEKGPPTLETLAGSVRVAARRVERKPDKPDGQREDHLVYFSVDSKGRVAYDFAGYDRHECEREAERVFKALRKRGILLMDAAKQAALDPERTSAEQLQSDDGMLPEPSMNKRQPHVHQAILDVLTKGMGFTQVNQTIIGGTIELDAHNGLGHSYHAEISSDGGTLIQLDGVDVSENADDRVAAAVGAVRIVDSSPDQEPESVPAYDGVSQWGQQLAGQSE